MAIQVLSIGNGFSQDAQRNFLNLKGDKREYTPEVNGNTADGFMTSIREALTARN